MAIKYRFKGHESFVLRDGWLTKGLIAIHNDPQIFSKNRGADDLGVGTNMANAIRYWLTAAGFAKNIPGKGYFLTDIGEIIYECDRYIEDIFSLWVFHCNLVTNYNQATSWNTFFNRFDASSFTRKDLVRSIIDICCEEIQSEALPESSIENDCACILQMYCDSKETGDPEDKKTSPFSSFGLITQNKNVYERKMPDLSTIDELLVLYLIQNALTNDGNLPIDEVVNGNNMPGRILSINRVAVNDFLDALADKGYIIVNRTAGLDTIYKNSEMTCLDILKAHYERKALD